ncbi:ParB/RepB/Spo0J family partition protein [Acetivibrio ethanolgignens]|uniref:Chromosome partitioning protein ParB n=1 Tax=Acetivibrio ethanolgignens TaxID=290052 RepID=A0A0V8QJ65_9FIRM|nr:ParB/RepB/Spo0J family partition protein [Acetivibrio ethanolgignens]KSV60593.1 chromosome partitioning protein ParB [Acetivibrio ethanolgignens]
MKKRSGEKIKILSVDELLGVPSGDPVTEIDVEKIYPFENHPFKVVEDEKMEDLIENIRYNGVLTPVVVRPDDEGGYEMISGHRRLYAVNKIGLPTIPATIKEMGDDDAVIAMVDSNIQREEILPSEKAFAYRMRYEAMRRRAGRPGKNSSQVGTNYRADEDLAKQVGESRNQVHRFIRLTEVIPELLDLIDRGNIAIMTGVDISHIDQKIQKWLHEYIRDNGTIKSYQIIALRKELNTNPDLTQEEVIQILNDNQPGRKPAMRINFTSNQLRKYFPAYYTSQEARAVIEELLANWKKEQDKHSKAVK